MKSKLFYAVVFISIGNIADAQIKTDNVPAKTSHYWNFNITAGITQNINNFTNGTGMTYNVDAAVVQENSHGLFVNLSYTDFNINTENLQSLRYPPLSEFSYFQITTGLRFYSPKKNTFADAGLGYYNVRGDNSVGMNFGLGGKVRLSDIYSIMINGRLNIASVLENPYLYFGLFAGIDISDKKELSPEYRKNKLSVTAYTGAIGQEVIALSDNAFTGELSYKLNDKMSLLANYLYSESHDQEYYVSGAYSTSLVKDEKKSNLTAGMRYYTSGNNVKFFLEGLTGIYINELSQITVTSFDQVYNYYVIDISDVYFGYTLGVGVEILIIDNLSGILKYDQFIPVSGEPSSGMFGGLKYSF